MWIKDKVNDCYKMSHSHLITIKKVNRHYILYFRDIRTTENVEFVMRQKK